MKLIIVSFVLSSFLWSDDIQRLETIVKEITQLRSDYEACEIALQSKKITIIPSLDEEREKLEKKLQKQEKLLLTQDKKIAYLEKLLQKPKNKTVVVAQVCEEENPFQKLMMKESPKDSLKAPLKVRAMAPTTFHLKVDAMIYDAPDGAKIESWEKETSFTSNKRAKNWIKITGYFIDKKWISSKTNMWIKEEQVLKK